MSGDRVIRVGSRKSELAIIQTRHVISLLKEIYPHKEFEIITMTTLGDRVLDLPLPKIGEKSLFTKDLEEKLASGCVDFVVHSLKDLPTILPESMAIGAVLEREDPRDALVLRADYDKYTLETLPKNSVIGTSSLRRAAQLHRKYPHLKVENIRGNLNTRLKKLDELGTFHAIILATAGLQRMTWDKRISKIIESDEILYAVGQGALAVECRELDEETIDLLRPLYDVQTAVRVIAERTFLRTLGGGCSAPVAVATELLKTDDNEYKLTMKGAVWSLDGVDELIEKDECTVQITKTCVSCPHVNKESNVLNISSTNDEVSKICPFTNNQCDNTDKHDKCTLTQPTKKLKVSHDFDNGNVNIVTNSTENLKSDSDKLICPISLPVGVDFMGKCPYLDSNGVTTNKCPMGYHINDVDTLDIKKCPYFELGNIPVANAQKIVVSANNNDDSNLYCGLVPHVDAPVSALQGAQLLGKHLAEKLKLKGAIGIMEKAQEHIRKG